MNPTLTITANVQSGVNSVRQYTRTIEDMRKSLQGARGDMDKLSRDEQELWDQLNDQVHQGLNSKMGTTWRRKLERLGLGDAHISQIMSAKLPTSDAAAEKFKRDLVQHFGGSVVNAEAEPSLGKVARGIGLRSISRAGRQIAQIFRIPLPESGFAGGAAAMGLGTVATAGVAAVADVGMGAYSGMNSERRRMVELDHFYRSLGDSATSFTQLNDEIKKAAGGLRLTYEESQNLTQVYARAAALSNSGAAVRGMRDSAGFARAFGFDPAIAAQAFGGIHRMTGGQLTEREIGRSLTQIAGAMGNVSLMPELLQSLAQMVAQMRISGGIAPDMNWLMSTFGAMNRSGNPAFQGAAGVSALQNAMSGVTTGGAAGDAGMVFNLGTVARANPDIKNPFLLMDLLQNPGMTAAGLGIGGGGATSMDAIMQQYGFQRGRPVPNKLEFLGSGRGSAMQRDLNQESMEKAYAMGVAYATGDNGQESLESAYARLGIDPNRISQSAQADIEQILTHHGRDVRLRLAQAVSAPARRQSFFSARPGGIDRQLRIGAEQESDRILGMRDDDLIKMLAASGGESTLGSSTENSQAALVNSNAALGSQLLDLRNSIDNLRTAMRGGSVPDMAPAQRGRAAPSGSR